MGAFMISFGISHFATGMCSSSVLSNTKRRLPTLQSSRRFYQRHHVRLAWHLPISIERENLTPHKDDGYLKADYNLVLLHGFFIGRILYKHLIFDATYHTLAARV